MSKPTIAVIIPNLNGKLFIGKAISSLEKQSEPVHVIVVENGSSDGSADYIRENHPDVELIPLPKNKGFAGGVNVGINRAIDLGFEFIGLFNNDAEADKSWSKNLLETIESDEKIGIVTGKLLRSDRVHLDSTGDFYTIWGMPFPRGRNQLADGQFTKTEEVFSASGGASVYRAALFLDIGLFDEDFFAYFEDVDVSFRARLRNWKIVYTPTAVAYHAVSKTSTKLGSNFSRYHSIKNFKLLYIRCMPGILFWKYLPFFAVQYARIAAGSIRDGKPHVFIKASAHALLLTPSALVKRHKIQQRRSVNIKKIESLLVKSRPPRIPEAPAQSEQ